MFLAINEILNLNKFFFLIKKKLIPHPLYPFYIFCYILYLYSFRSIYDRIYLSIIFLNSKHNFNSFLSKLSLINLALLEFRKLLAFHISLPSPQLLQSSTKPHLRFISFQIISPPHPLWNFALRSTNKKNLKSLPHIWITYITYISQPPSTLVHFIPNT